MRCGSSPRRRSHLSVNMTEGMVIVGGVISAKIPIIPAVQGSSPRRRSHPRGIYRRFTSPRFISATAEITAIRLGAVALSKAHLRACGVIAACESKTQAPWAHLRTCGGTYRRRLLITQNTRRAHLRACGGTENFILISGIWIGSSPRVRRYLKANIDHNKSVRPISA